MSEATRLLDAMSAGDPQAAAALMPLVYEELRRLARARMAQERREHTLQPTALVHEAYMRLMAGGAPQQQWDGRRHFFAAAAEAMRRILVEHARRKSAAKRGGALQRVELDDEPGLGAIAPPCADIDDLLAVNEALDRLAAEDAQLAELVKLSFFAGLSLEQSAEALGISRATAYRNWDFARAWLRDAIDGAARPVSSQKSAPNP